MSYSEKQARYLLFSSDGGSLEGFTSNLREYYNKKGIQYKGPHDLPTINSEKLILFLDHLHSSTVAEEKNDTSRFPWVLFKIAEDEDHRQFLVEAAKNQSRLYAKEFVIIGQSGIKTALTFNLPDSVFATVTIGKREHTKGKGNSIYTWDPNIDNIPSHPDG
jgi:hypothetical protein